MEKRFAQLLRHAWRVGDLILFKALTGGAFDRLNWQHSEEFDQKLSKKSNAHGVGMGSFGIDRYISCACVVIHHRNKHSPWNDKAVNMSTAMVAIVFACKLELDTQIKRENNEQDNLRY